MTIRLLGVMAIGILCTGALCTPRDYPACEATIDAKETRIGPEYMCARNPGVVTATWVTSSDWVELEIFSPEGRSLKTMRGSPQGQTTVHLDGLGLPPGDYKIVLTAKKSGEGCKDATLEKKVTLVGDEGAVYTHSVKPSQPCHADRCLGMRGSFALHEWMFDRSLVWTSTKLNWLSSTPVSRTPSEVQLRRGGAGQTLCSDAGCDNTKLVTGEWQATESQWAASPYAQYDIDVTFPEPGLYKDGSWLAAVALKLDCR